MILIASCSLRLIYFCIFFFTNAIFNQFFSYFKGESYILKFYLMEHGFVVHKRICACPSLFNRNISSWYWSNNLCYFFVLERILSDLTVLTGYPGRRGINDGQTWDDGYSTPAECPPPNHSCPAVKRRWAN